MMASSSSVTAAAMSVAAAAVRAGRRSVASSAASTSSWLEAPIASSSRSRLPPTAASARDFSTSSIAPPTRTVSGDARSDVESSGMSRRSPRRSTGLGRSCCVSSETSRSNSWFSPSSANRFMSTRSMHNSTSSSSAEREPSSSIRSSSDSPFNNPSPRSITPHPSMHALQTELTQHILPGFALPDEVALQMVTHESWDYGKGLAGHNRRLSFLGRRALKAFLIMFFDTILSSSQTRASQQQIQRTRASLYPSTPAAFSPLEELLHTSALGQGAGSSLRLERVMRWTPAILPPSSSPSSTFGGAPVVSEGRETGLYKIRGVCLEAVVGAIYHQHGASMAQLFFQSQILPTLVTRDSRWSVSKDLGEWVRIEMEKCAEESTRVLNGRIQMQVQQQEGRLTKGGEATLEHTPSQQVTSSSTSQAAGSIPAQTPSAFSSSSTPPPDGGIKSGASRQAAMA